MIYGYIRVSTNGQDISMQTSEIMKYIVQNKIILDEYIEEVISSRVVLEDRRLYTLLNRLEKGDSLLVYELSRLGRSIVEIMNIADMILKKKAELVITSKNLVIKDDDINSKVFLFAFGIAAEIERDLISQRTKSGLEKARLAGKKLGRPKGSKSKSKLDPYEEQIKELLNKKVSKASICKIYSVSASTLDNFIKTRNINN